MRIRLGVLLLAVLALLPSTPARAVGAFGGNVQVAADCSLPLLGLGSDGVTRGFVRCRSGNRFVQGSGTHWSSVPVSVGGTVRAAAVDGTTTWYVVQTSAGMYIRSRTAAGSVGGGPRFTTTTSPEGLALTASGGKWWVVWGQPTGQGGFNLYEAHTLAGNGATRLAYSSGATITDAYPSLVWLPATKTAVIAWTHGRSQGSFSVVRTTSKGAAWGRITGVDSAGSGPVVVASGSVVAIADYHGTPNGPVLGVYVGAATGAMPLHVSSLTLGANPISIAISGGRITAAFNAHTSSSPVPRVMERNGSAWSEVTVVQPAGSSALDTQSYRGRARVFFERGLDVVVRSQ